MNKREQALNVMKKLRECKPTHIFKNVSDMDTGMTFVLIFLSENSGDVYASTISENMNISRARVTVLLKKMESKGLIEKNVSNLDARIEVIKTTEYGKEQSNLLKEKALSNIIKVIDEVGFNELNQFLSTAGRIKDILEE